MSLTINPDIVTQQELQSRGVDSSVGVFGSHHVQIGNGTPIRLDEIKSAKVPYAGFKTATQIRRGKAGIEQTASDALKTLAASGSLDAGKLLGFLKAQQTHLERLVKLDQLDPAQKQDEDGLWMFTKAVEKLSNEDLASIFQKFTSPEMDLLQTALMREGQINPKAKDARIAASRLFNLQALVLKEIGNRAALSNLSDLRGANPADVMAAARNVMYKDLCKPAKIGELMSSKKGLHRHDRAGETRRARPRRRPAQRDGRRAALGGADDQHPARHPRGQNVGLRRPYQAPREHLAPARPAHRPQGHGLPRQA